MHDDNPDAQAAQAATREPPTVFTDAFAGYNEPSRIVSLGAYLATARVLETSGALRAYEREGTYSAGATRPLRRDLSWTGVINALNGGRKWAHRRLRDQIDAMLAPGVALAIVPSHDPFVDTPPLRLLAQELAANGRINATGCLVRHTKIKRIVYGGPSHRSLHLQTIAVRDEALVAGRAVLLLDDIVRSGASLRACRELLLRAGAGSVQAMALGKVASTPLHGGESRAPYTTNRDDRT